ncbi:MAG: acetoin utilization protein AcuC [Paracoccaceae bacterium]
MMAKTVDPILVGSEIYRGSTYGAGHPLRVPRVSTVMDLSRALGWLPPDRYRTSPRAKPAALTLWHTPDYIAALHRAEAEGHVTPEVTARHGLGTLSNPVHPRVWSRPATSAGGVMWAADHLAHRGGAVYVPGGGTHHGLPDRAAGFCYLNDPVLGILTLLNAGLSRIVYVDIDAHHCDGVELAFAGDPRVRMISVHEEGRWPFTGRLDEDAGGSAFNLPVPAGFHDTDMRAVMDGLILPRTAEFQPQAIVLQCGADALLEDPLSRLALSNNAHWSVVAALHPLAPRFLVLGGGGYNPWSVARCWAGVWATLSGQEVPDRLPEPARSVLAALDWGGGGRAGPASDLLDRLRDAPREGSLDVEIRNRLATLARR